MVRTRFELKSVIDEIKNFTGSKEQEKAKVEELNRKYGESFGYYQTLSEWYDTIRKKSEDYVQSLFLQMKVQSLVKKHQKSMIRLQRQRRRMKANLIHGGGMAERLTVSFLPTSPTNRIIMVAGKKKEELERLQKEYDGYIGAAENLAKERIELDKKAGIGGHTDPEQSGKNAEAEAKQRLAAERRLAQELAALQAENRKAEIDRMQAGTEKKLAQIEYDYNARKEEINRQEAAWKRENKEAGLSTGDNGLTREQQDELEKARASNAESRKKRNRTCTGKRRKPCVTI